MKKHLPLIIILAAIVVIIATAILFGKNNTEYGARLFSQFYTLYNAYPAANGATVSTVRLPVTDYRTTVCELSAHNTPAYTIKFVGSVSTNPPDWDVVRSTTNTWDYVQVVDLEDGSTIDGDTGITFTGTADTRLLEVNSNLLRWFGADLTSHTTGSSTLKCRPANND